MSRTWFSTNGTDYFFPPQPLPAGFFSSSVLTAPSVLAPQPLPAGFFSSSVLTAPSVLAPQPLPAGFFSSSVLTAPPFPPQPLPAGLFSFSALTALLSFAPQPLPAWTCGGNDTPAADTRVAIPSPARIFFSSFSPILNLLYVVLKKFLSFFSIAYHLLIDILHILKIAAVVTMSNE